MKMILTGKYECSALFWRSGSDLVQNQHVFIFWRTIIRFKHDPAVCCSWNQTNKTEINRKFTVNRLSSKKAKHKYFYCSCFPFWGLVKSSHLQIFHWLVAQKHDIRWKWELQPPWNSSQSSIQTRSPPSLRLGICFSGAPSFLIALAVVSFRLWRLPTRASLRFQLWRVILDRLLRTEGLQGGAHRVYST